MLKMKKSAFRIAHYYKGKRTITRYANNVKDAVRAGSGLTNPNMTVSIGKLFGNKFKVIKTYRGKNYAFKSSGRIGRIKRR